MHGQRDPIWLGFSRLTDKGYTVESSESYRFMNVLIK